MVLLVSMGIIKRRGSPSVTSVDNGASIYQKLAYLLMSFSSSHMQCGTTIIYAEMTTSLVRRLSPFHQAHGIQRKEWPPSFLLDRAVNTYSHESLPRTDSEAAAFRFQQDLPKQLAAKIGIPWRTPQRGLPSVFDRTSPRSPSPNNAAVDVALS